MVAIVFKAINGSPKKHYVVFHHFLFVLKSTNYNNAVGANGPENFLWKSSDCHHAKSDQPRDGQDVYFLPAPILSFLFPRTRSFLFLSCFLCCLAFFSILSAKPSLTSMDLLSFFLRWSRLS